MSCENCANAYDEGYTAGHNAENARLREQAEALATALEHACSGQLSKVEWARVVDEADAALRAYREATP